MSEPAKSSAACVAGLRALYGQRIRAADEAAVSKGDAACRVVDPVVVEAFQIGPNAVPLTPPATLSCEMATRVGQWIGGSMLALTRGMFGRDLDHLQVGGGHECRRRNRSSAGPLSEHATGRALDIFAFVLSGDAKDAKIIVEKPDSDLQRQFLTAIRQSACGAFATSLGPGADAAHANHIHVDIQVRRAASTRFCQ